MDKYDILVSLYDDELSEVISNRETPHFLRGGAGVGKSPFLKLVFERLELEYENVEHKKMKEGVNYVFLNGRQIKEIYELLLNETGVLYQKEVIIIWDDFDYFVFNLKHHYEANAIRDTMKKLYGLFSDLKQNKTKLFLTSTVTLEGFDDVYKEGDEYTKLVISFLPGFQSIVLDPWKAGYAEKFYNRAFSIMKYGNLVPENIVKLWLECIENLSGYHPTLFHGMMLKFETVKKNSLRFKEYEVKLLNELNNETEPERKEKITRFLEDNLTEFNISSIRKTLLKIANSSNPTYIEAKKLLLGLAENGGIMPAVNFSLYVRNLLFENGLVTNDPNLTNIIIPGKIIQKEILRLYGSVAKTPSIILQQISADRGRIIRNVEKNETILYLSGNSWILLYYLYKNMERVNSLENIQKDLSLPSLGAARSIIQRLELKLKENGFIKVIENVRGEGYKMNI